MSPRISPTFLQRTHRDAFRRLATQLGVPFTILDLHATVETLRHRVACRSARADDASEADLAILQGQLATREPLTTTEQACALVINTDTPQAFERLLEAVHALTEEH